MTGWSLFSGHVLWEQWGCLFEKEGEEGGGGGRGREGGTKAPGTILDGPTRSPTLIFVRRLGCGTAVPLQDLRDASMRSKPGAAFARGALASLPRTTPTRPSHGTRTIPESWWGR